MIPYTNVQDVKRGSHRSGLEALPRSRRASPGNSPNGPQGSSHSTAEHRAASADSRAPQPAHLIVSANPTVPHGSSLTHNST